MQAFCQSKPKEVSALEKKAENYFREGKYVLAKDVYSTLLSNYPKDPFYSYRFGVCLMFGDRRDPEKPVQYLELASRSPDMEPEVFYYLGKAYHFNYRFVDAIRMYEKYLSLAGKSKAAGFGVERDIGMCRNGLYLLSRVKDIVVIDKKEVRRTDFQRSYVLSGFTGEYLKKPEVFLTKQDRRKKEAGLVFFPAGQEFVLFSGYGEDNRDQRDLYLSYLLPNQTWSKAAKLPGGVNSLYDEDYPYLLPDGKTLYFSSRGHNSMGGYDIFRSVLDTVTGTWGEPENMDFAVNTPYDDLLFVADPDGKYAFFASDRSTVGDKIMVYLVRADQRPERSLDEEIRESVAATAPGQEIGRQQQEILAQMAKLEVNAAENQAADIPSSVRIDASAMASVADHERFESVVKEKIRERAITKAWVDTSYALLGKFEERIKDLKDLTGAVQKVSNEASVLAEKKMAGTLYRELSGEIKKKENRLAAIRKMAGDLQQMAGSNPSDTVRKRFESITSAILPSDTASDYRMIISDMATGGQPLTKAGRTGDSFLEGWKAPMTSAERDVLQAVLQQTRPPLAVVTGKAEGEGKIAETKVADSEKMQQAQTEKSRETAQGSLSRPDAVQDRNRKAEEVNRITDELRVLRDSMNALQEITERQRLLLLDLALESSNEAGSMLDEVNKMKAVAESVITDGSTRDLRQAASDLSREAGQQAEKAVLAYALAARIGEREEVVKKAVSELEKRALEITALLDSGQTGRASALLESVRTPLREYQKISFANDDVIPAIHRHTRELKVEVLANLKTVRNTLIEVKTLNTASENLKSQASKTADKKEARKLLSRADEMDKTARQKQQQAQDLFNQNMIWDNRTRALESAMPGARSIMNNITLRAAENYIPPRKKIRDTTLLVPVILDILSASLPAADNEYQSLVVTRGKEAADPAMTRDELISRTSSVAAMDAEMIAEQTRRVKEKPDLLVFEDTETAKVKEGQEKESTERSKLLGNRERPEQEGQLSQTLVNNKREKAGEESAEIVKADQEQAMVQPKVDAARRWEEDRPSFRMLQSQVDTLYDRLKQNPSLRVSPALMNLLQNLTDMADSLEQSHAAYESPGSQGLQGQDTEPPAMVIALEGLEVRATANRLKYLINRLTVNDLASSGGSLRQRNLKAALAASDSLYAAADQLRKQAARQASPRNSLTLMQRAELYEDLAGLEQQNLADSLRLSAGISESGIKPPAKDLSMVQTTKADVVQSAKQPDRQASAQPEAGRTSQQQAPSSGTLVTGNTVSKPSVTGDAQVVAQQAARPEAAKGTSGENGSGLLQKPINQLNTSEKAVVTGMIRRAVREAELPLLPGLVYSVQVGVFGSPRTTSQLFGITPLFGDRTAGGLYRYFSGLFGKRDDAVQYKNEMVRRGVPDAFVVVFYRGRKISLAEAASLSGESLNIAIRQDDIQRVIAEEKPPVASEAYFSVQLAAYRRLPTDAETALFRDRTGRVIEMRLLESGLHVLVTGKLNRWEEALQLRSEMIAKGVSDAFIVGFINGKRVMAGEARKTIAR